MAYYPEHCDKKCSGCKKNINGWCIWLDKATPGYMLDQEAELPENINA